LVFIYFLLVYIDFNPAIKIKHKAITRNNPGLKTVQPLVKLNTRIKLNRYKTKRLLISAIGYLIYGFCI